MGTLEQELKKIHDAGLGVVITWLSDWRVDLRLVHRNGAVMAEGDVGDVANVLPWLVGAIKKHFPQAKYEHAASHDARSSQTHDRSGAAGNGSRSGSHHRVTPLMDGPSRMAAGNEP
jgi:hypothetical protein